MEQSIPLICRFSNHRTSPSPLTNIGFGMRRITGGETWSNGPSSSSPLVNSPWPWVGFFPRNVQPVSRSHSCLHVANTTRENFHIYIYIYRYHYLNYHGKITPIMFKADISLALITILFWTQQAVCLCIKIAWKQKDLFRSLNKTLFNLIHWFYSKNIQNIWEETNIYMHFFKKKK